jgi:hypothetical protein
MLNRTAALNLFLAANVLLSMPQTGSRLKSEALGQLNGACDMLCALGIVQTPFAAKIAALDAVRALGAQPTSIPLGSSGHRASPVVVRVLSLSGESSGEGQPPQIF